MNFNTILQELYNKIRKMDRKSFNDFISKLQEYFNKTHKHECKYNADDDWCDIKGDN